MEYNFEYGVRIPDDMRLALGTTIVERFFAEEPKQDECTEWLEELGFDRVEWAQPNDHTLLCLLWRAGTVEQDSGRQTGGSMVDEFMLEFAGEDPVIICSLFNFVKERLVYLG